jgi:hypothetical protein
MLQEAQLMPTSILEPFVVRYAVPLPAASDRAIVARAARSDAYRIYVTRTVPETLARLVELLEGAKVAMITDETPMALHGGPLLDGLRDAGLDVQVSAVPTGEASKSLEQAVRLWNWLARSSLARRDVILTFGGGVVNDTGGWVASAYMRGIPYVNVPITAINRSTGSSARPSARASATSSGTACRARARPTARWSTSTTRPTPRASDARPSPSTTWTGSARRSSPRARSRARR